MARNVLIFHLGALGDFVLTWPLALALGRMHPQSRIIYVTHAQKGALAEAALRVESADIEGGWHHLHGSAELLPAGAGKMLAGAHHIYSFVASEGDLWHSQVSHLAPEAKVCCLNPTLPPDYLGHWTNHLLSQLEGRAGVAEAVRQMLYSIADRGIARRAADGKIITIHPGSGSASKCWPAENYLELARRFRAAGQEVCVLLGEVERERWPAERIQHFSDVATVARPSTYVELQRHLSNASRFIGNDSGPAHLAGILGVPTFCIFGPSDPAVWRPLGPKVRVRRRMPIGLLGVDEVFDWVEHGLSE